MRLSTVGLVAGALVVSACERQAPEPFALEPVAFSVLDGWADDASAAALTAFLRSCAPILRRDPEAPFAANPLAGSNADWQDACRAAQALPASVEAEDGAVRAYFETWFQPYRVLADGAREGLFTGYYEPLLTGSFEPLPGGVPLRRAPGDIVTVELGQFADDLADRRVRGRVNGHRLIPYFDRGEIERGALDGRGLELVWVADPIEKFFL